VVADSRDLPIPTRKRTCTRFNAWIGTSASGPGALTKCQECISKPIQCHGC